MEEIIKQILHELANNYPTIVCVVAMAYISVLLTSVIGDNNEIKEIATLAVLSIGSAPLLSDLSVVVNNAKETVGEVQATLTASVPALATMNLGKESTSQVVFFLLTEIIITLLNKVFFPLVLIYVALSFCSSISNKFNVDGVKNTVKSFFTWGLGTMMIIFSVVSLLCGALDGAKQSLLGRTLKYTGSMVPVVGRYLSESADMTFAGINVMKSTMGITATTTLMGIIITPIIRIASYVLLYRLCGTVIKPVDNSGLHTVANSVADAFTMIGGIIILISVMAVMNVSMLVKITIG